MTRVRAIERFILVKEIIGRDESAVYVTLAQIDGGEAVVLDLSNSFAVAGAKDAPEDQQSAVTKNHVAAEEGGMAARLVVECSRHLKGETLIH